LRLGAALTAVRLGLRLSLGLRLRVATAATLLILRLRLGLRLRLVAAVARVGIMAAIGVVSGVGLVAMAVGVVSGVGLVAMAVSLVTVVLVTIRIGVVRITVASITLAAVVAEAAVVTIITAVGTRAAPRELGPVTPMREVLHGILAAVVTVTAIILLPAARTSAAVNLRPPGNGRVVTGLLGVERLGDEDSGRSRRSWQDRLARRWIVDPVLPGRLDWAVVIDDPAELAVIPARVLGVALLVTVRVGIVAIAMTISVVPVIVRRLRLRLGLRLGLGLALVEVAGLAVQALAVGGGDSLNNDGQRRSREAKEKGRTHFGVGLLGESSSTKCV